MNRLQNVVAAVVLTVTAFAVADTPTAIAIEPDGADLPEGVAEIVDAVDGVPDHLVSTAQGTVTEDNLTLETSSGGSVEIPLSSTEPIRLQARDGTELSVVLPASGRAGDSVSTSDSIIHPDVMTDVSVSVRPTADAGAQAILVIDDESAPTTFDFGINSSSGVELIPQDDGSIRIATPEGGDLGTVHAPWALDADGANVPTRFEVSGTTITQVVEHRYSDFAYPIVADPKITFGRRIYVYMWGWEIFQYGAALTLVGGVAGIAGCEGIAKLPTAVSRGIKVLCIGIGGPSVLSLFRAIERLYKSLDHDACYEWTVPSSNGGRFKVVRDRNC